MLKQIYAIIGQKGGVGKTSTSLALFDGLTARKNKCLFIDLDPQANASLSLKVNLKGLSIVDVLEGTPAEEVMQKTERGFVIPAPADSMELAQEVLSINDLHKALQPVKDSFDYIVIDCPPALGDLTVNALYCCTSVILPSGADEYSTQGIARLNSVTIPVVNERRKQGNLPPIKVAGILVCKYNARAVYSQNFLAYLQKVAQTFEPQTQVFNTKIRNCIAISEAGTLKQPVFVYSPKSNASIDYDNFINELLKKEGK